MRIRALTEVESDDLFDKGIYPEVLPDEILDSVQVFYVVEQQDEDAAFAEIIRRVNLHDELVGALMAIVARVRGEWDQPDLVAYGALRTSPETDMSLIAQQALEKATT